MTSKKSFSDQEVVQAILSGNARQRSTVFRFIYREQYPKVLQLLKGKGCDENQAADVFQDAIIVLYNQVRAGKYKGSGSLANYLKSIALHLWYRTFRKLELLINVNDYNGELESVPEVEVDSERFLKLKQAISNLDVPCREVLIDFYYRGISVQEIQTKYALGSAQAAKNKKYRCLQKLIKLIKNESSDLSSMDLNNEIAS